MNESLHPLALSYPSPGVALLSLSGKWVAADNLPDPSETLTTISAEGAKEIRFDSSAVETWDSGLLVFLVGMDRLAAKHGINVRRDGLQPQISTLFELSVASDEHEASTKCPRRYSFVEQVGVKAINVATQWFKVIAFIGDATLSLSNFFIGRSRMRLRTLLFTIQRAGPEALPIVTLISVLVGLILAFIGSVQLKQFGAEVYIANLVGLGMTREMGPIMVGIILAGRTGAAFAAELGAMQANEEIDALKTFGISPTDFLVLPKMLALMLMTPLLCVYADVLGVFGGAIVTFFTSEISPRLYWTQTIGALHLNDFFLGLVKSLVFGVLVAISGCLRGMNSGRNSAAVGDAATSAVVTGIVLIVIADALFAVIASVLGI